MKITRRQLRQIIKEELSLLESNSDSDDHGEKLDPDLLKGAYVSSKEDREAMKDYIAKLKAKKKSMDSDGDGALDADEIRAIADDLEGESEKPLRLSAPTRSPWQLKAELGIGQGTGPYDKHGKRKKGWRHPLSKDPKRGSKK